MSHNKWFYNIYLDFQGTAIDFQVPNGKDGTFRKNPQYQIDTSLPCFFSQRARLSFSKGHRNNIENSTLFHNEINSNSIIRKISFFLQHSVK